MDDIRFVNRETSNLKSAAFLEATQKEKLSDDLFSQDFTNIINNEKVDIFIQEFEDVMANLSSQTPKENFSTQDLDKLLQFKLSIHFIKVLSEMMQATYLNQFSSTIIDFLEDVIDGKIKMATDTSHRLNVVISLYSHYINSIKTQASHRLNA